MATNDSTSNNQTKENSAIPSEHHSSPLRCIISNAHLLHQTGYDEKNHKATYVGNTADLSYLESSADCTITTMALGISAIGKLVVSQDEQMTCIDKNDISALGWLLNDLGASIVALQNIQTLAGDAVSAAKRNN